MIDRVDWIWRWLDFETRGDAIAGGTRMFGTPNPDGTLEDDQDMKWVGPTVKLKDLLNTMGGNGGKFCYYYV